MTIPEITQTRLTELCSRIKPVVRFAQVSYQGEVHYERHSKGDLYFIAEKDPRRVSFIWDPQPIEQAHGLTRFGSLTTYHLCGGFYHKPSVAEVLAQIPESYIDRVSAFETINGNVNGNSDYSTAKTILYRMQTSSELEREIQMLGELRDNLEARLQ